MPAAPRRVSARAALLGAALTAVALTVSLADGLTRHGALLVHQCVSAEGTAGWLGLRLALLRPEADCPTGTLAVGGDGRHVMGVVVLVALPVLLAHLTGLAISIGAVARLHSLVRSALAVLGWVGRRRPVARALVVRRVRASAVVVDRPAPGASILPAPWRRGPPAPRFA
ncbi:MAG TPA: hypothetical protein VN257_01165 [Actinotalea sp.]|nr:hypothetical protein [Actinotalea sp.]